MMNQRMYRMYQSLAALRFRNVDISCAAKLDGGQVDCREGQNSHHREAGREGPF